jgi:hypothetical protein
MPRSPTIPRATNRRKTRATTPPERVEYRRTHDSAARAAYVRHMNERDPFARLPEAYGRALRLRREGADEAAIAAELGIQREAVGPLLRIADAKLATLRTASDPNAHRHERR